MDTLKLHEARKTFKYTVLNVIPCFMLTSTIFLATYNSEKESTHLNFKSVKNSSELPLDFILIPIFEGCVIGPQNDVWPTLTSVSLLVPFYCFLLFLINMCSAAKLVTQNSFMSSSLKGQLHALLSTSCDVDFTLCNLQLYGKFVGFKMSE